MSRTLPLTLLLSLLPLQDAAAQTRIGNVTLTRPATPAPRTARVAVAAPASIPARPASTPSTNVPAGWSEVKGRIGAATPVSLPAGSTVHVLMEDRTTGGASVVAIEFKTSRLSTPYQIIFSPGRLNGRHSYTVRAEITASDGRVLYRSSAVPVPNAPRNVINLTVR